MKNKWKICVMSGAVMVFAVLGALILAQNVMSSADGTEKEFQLVQGTREHQASGGAASQKTEEPEESGAPTAAGTAKSGGSGEEKKTEKPEALKPDCVLSPTASVVSFMLLRHGGGAGGILCHVLPGSTVCIWRYRPARSGWRANLGRVQFF